MDPATSAADAARGGTSGGVAISLPIRWGDMDALGHVNNIIYFQYCESARIAYFERMGYERFRPTPRHGPGMVTASLNFRRQLHYPGTVTVRARVTRIGGKSFTLHYDVIDESDGQVVADGESVCVWVDYAQGRAEPLPRMLVDAIVEIEGDPGLRPAEPPST